MAVFRVNKTKDYTVMSNSHLRDKRLSFKAKGILSVMLSLPEKWDYSIAGLETLSSDGSSATRSALKELELNGYLIRRAVRVNGKIIDWEYNIFESPQVEIQDIEKPLVENQQVENQTQLNTNKENTEELSTDLIKESKKESNKYKETYNKVFDEFGVFGEYRAAMFRWIAHLKAVAGLNFVIYDRLENIIIALDRNYNTYHDKVCAIDEAIKCGYKRLDVE